MENNDNNCEKEQPRGFGAEVAMDAIEEMDSECHDAEEFIKACERAGKDPVKVIAHISCKNDLDLMGDEPVDQPRKGLYLLLRSVIRFMSGIRDDEDGSSDDRSSYKTCRRADRDCYRKGNVFIKKMPAGAKMRRSSSCLDCGFSDLCKIIEYVIS